MGLHIWGIFKQGDIISSSWIQTDTHTRTHTLLPHRLLERSANKNRHRHNKNYQAHSEQIKGARGLRHSLLVWGVNTITCGSRGSCLCAFCCLTMHVPVPSAGTQHWNRTPRIFAPGYNNSLVKWAFGLPIKTPVCIPFTTTITFANRLQVGARKQW